MRRLLLLAAVAALLGAPSFASAAGGALAAPSVSPASGTVTDEPTGVFDEDGLLNTVLLVGLAGVAAVTVIGTAWLVVGGRRRRPEDEGQIPAPGRTDTDALLERRTLRQAKVRLSGDPIVAAMGVDDQVAERRRRRRASPVAGGPSERPNRARR